MKFLSLNNLSIGYKSKKKKTIVQDKINLSGSQNEIIALIGMNGIGKSTLLRTIAGLQECLSGQIKIKNKNISDFSRKKIAHKISFVASSMVNIHSLKVKELIALGRFPHTNWLGTIQQKDKKIIETAIELTETKALANKNINQISDGERQRAMFARAIAQDTDIIILDEPTAFLDLSVKHHLIYILKKLATEKNKLIIFSTHDLNIAIKHADKIWLMYPDKIISGAPEDLILNNGFSNIFQNQNITFDNFSGDFNVLKTKFKYINLINNTNNNLYYLWTQRALNRKGYKINKNSSDIISINKNNGTFVWKINLNNKHFFCNSIYELLNKI